MFDLPAVTWALLAFVIVFIAYFIKPTFLNPDHVMQLGANFPAEEPIGIDVRQYLGFSQALLQTGSPYIESNYYPPLESIFFLPLTGMDPNQAYGLVTLISTVLFLWTSLIFPLLLSKERRITSTLILFLTTGLFSYGFWFQLERGQYDILVMAICFAAIYIYHYHPRARFAAYALFVLSVQLKIYPGIFIILFSKDWHDWKNNLRRWGALLLANFAGLFVLGPKVFVDFVTSLKDQMQVPRFVSLVDHSINSFVNLVVQKIGAHGGYTKPQLREFINIMQYALLVVIFVCLALVLWRIYQKRLNPLNPYLLLMLTVSALVIPTTSHDYVFSAFVAPFALFFNTLSLRRSGKLWLDILMVGLVFLIGLVYASTLFVHISLPLWLTNNLPALMLIGAAIPILFWVQTGQTE